MSKPKPEESAKAPAAPSAEDPAAPVVPEQILAHARPRPAVPVPGIRPLSERINRVGRAANREGLTEKRVEALPARELGFLTGPSEQETAHRKRVEQVRAVLGKLVSHVDHDTRLALELVRELETLQGGTEAAQKEGFDLARAKQLATDLDALVDRFAKAES